MILSMRAARAAVTRGAMPIAQADAHNTPVWGGSVIGAEDRCHQSTQAPATGCAYSKDRAGGKAAPAGRDHACQTGGVAQGGAYRCPQAHQSGDHDRCLRSDRALSKGAQQVPAAGRNRGI